MEPKYHTGEARPFAIIASKDLCRNEAVSYHPQRKVPVSNLLEKEVSWRDCGECSKEKHGGRKLF